MSEKSLHSLARPPIDEDLALILYNEKELGDRMGTLFRSTVISALASSLQQRTEASKQDVKLLEQFFTQTEEGIGRIRDGLRGLFGTSEAIADQIEGKVGNLASRLVALEPQGIFTESNPVVVDAIRHAVAALRELVTKFTIQALSDDAQLQLLDTTPSGHELTVHSFLDVHKEKKPELIFQNREPDNRVIDDLFENRVTEIGSIKNARENNEQNLQNVESAQDSQLQVSDEPKWFAEVEVILPNLKSIVGGSFILESEYRALIENGNWRQKFHEAKKVDHVATIRHEIVEKLIDPMTEDEIEKEAQFLTKKREGEISIQLDETFPDFLRAGTLDSYKIIPKRGSSTTFKTLQATIDCFTELKREISAAALQLTFEGIETKASKWTGTMMFPDHLDTDRILAYGSKNSIVGTQKSWGLFASKMIPNYQKTKKGNEELRAAMRQVFMLIPVAMEKEFQNNRFLNSYQEVKQAFQRCLEIVGEVLHSASFPISTPAHVMSKIRATFVYIYNHELILRYHQVLAAYSKFQPAEEEMYLKDPVLKVLFETYAQGRLPDKEDVEKKSKANLLSVGFLRKLSECVLSAAINHLHLQKDGKPSAVKDNIRRQLILPAAEAALVTVINKLPKNGLQTAEEAKKYISCLRGIIEAVPSTIDIDGQILEVPSDFMEHLRSQLEELSLRIFSLCPVEALAVEEDAGKEAVFMSDPLAQVFERARMRKASQTLPDESAKPLSKPQDALQEAMEVADISHNAAAAYIERLMVTALEMAGTKIFSGKVTTLNQPYIEDIHAEVVRFSVFCIEIIDEEISRVIVPESAPSTEQLRTIVTQTIKRAGEHATQDNHFLTKDDRDAFLHQAFSAFLEPTIHADTLLVEGTSIAIKVRSDGGQEAAERAPATPRFPRLHSAAQKFTEVRDRGALRKEEQERQVRLLGLPDAVRYIEEQQTALSAMIRQLIENAQAGDLRAMETLQDSGDHIQLLRQLLALRIQSSR